jgi:hypothetical protein
MDQKEIDPSSDMFSLVGKLDLPSEGSLSEGWAFLRR